MRLLRKITVKKENGDFDGIEIELDFPEIMGMPALDSVLDKLDALKAMIDDGHAGRKGAAPADPVPAAPVAPPPPAKVEAKAPDPALIGQLMLRVSNAKSAADLLSVKAELVGQAPALVKTVSEAARAKWVSSGFKA